MTDERRTGVFAKRHGRRMARFAVAGAFSALTDFGLFALFVSLGAHPAAANIGSFLAANAQSYIVNARLTFREGGAPAPLSLGGYRKFLLAHLVSAAFSTAVVVALAAPIGPIWAKVAATWLAAVWNYGASALFVFRPGRQDGAGPGPESA